MRRKLVETGDVDIMIAIRSNFFYTRTVPCELWFLNRAKPERRRGKVLMIDARGIFRKVTRKIYDFSPEQMRNLLAIVHLYRGRTERFLDLVADYCRGAVREGAACLGAAAEFLEALAALQGTPGADHGPDGAAGALGELDAARAAFERGVDAFGSALAAADRTRNGERPARTAVRVRQPVDRLAPLAAAGRGLAQHTDRLHSLAARRAAGSGSSAAWNNRAVTRTRRAADAARRNAVERLERVRYLWRQAQWLVERFPDAELRDVAGLVKLVDRTEIAANDWSLTPGRYVGIAPEEDEDLDFAQKLRDIHAELDDLDAEAATLAAKISQNFKALGSALS